jgi:bla regulator protein BlaR1
MAEHIFFNILEISLTMSALIIVFLIILPLLKKRFTAKWRYLIWLFFTLRLLVPLNISLPSASFSLYTPQYELTYPAEARTIPTDDVPTDNLHTAQLPGSNTRNPPMNWPRPESGIPQVEWHQADAANLRHETVKSISSADLLLMVWSVGMLIFTIYLFGGHLLFRRSVLRWCRPVRQQRVTDTWTKLYRELGINKHIMLMVCGKIHSPMLTGFFRPVILLPHEDYGDEALTVILRHELTYYRHFDLWYKLLLSIGRAVHWFNPLVWLMVRAAERDIEASCDEAVVGEQDLDYRLRYCEAVLSAVQGKKTYNIALSTNFAGGKKSMKDRFGNILDTGKKRKGITALCLSVLLIFIAGMMIACKSPNDPDAPKSIKNSTLLEPGTVYARNANSDTVISYDAGHSYSLDDQGNVIISYNNGENITKAPLTLDVSDEYIMGMEAYETGFYISEEKTAVVYGYANGAMPLHVLISDDMGKSWNDYTIEGAQGYDTKFVGFLTKEDGWIVTGGSAGVGRSVNSVYRTSDGGKTWTELGNPNDLYPEHLTGAGFSTKDIGFLGFRVYTDKDPIVYWTQDAGKTWEKYEMAMPEFDAYTKTPMSPVFWDAKGLWPISIRKDDNTFTVYMTSQDYGRTWTYDDSVLSKGRDIPFTLKAENKDYIRATLPKEWDELRYIERFPESSMRTEAANHTLFELPAGASASYPFFADLGFGEGDDIYQVFSPGDYVDYIGLLIFNVRVREVKLLGQQAAIVAEPSSAGYQVVFLDRDDLPEGNVYIRLMTSDGRGLDELVIAHD